MFISPKSGESPTGLFFCTRFVCKRIARLGTCSGDINGQLAFTRGPAGTSSSSLTYTTPPSPHPCFVSQHRKIQSCPQGTFPIPVNLSRRRPFAKTAAYSRPRRSIHVYEVFYGNVGGKHFRKAVKEVYPPPPPNDCNNKRTKSLKSLVPRDE